MFVSRTLGTFLIFQGFANESEVLLIRAGNVRIKIAHFDCTTESPAYVTITNRERKPVMPNIEQTRLEHLRDFISELLKFANFFITCFPWHYRVSFFSICLLLIASIILQTINGSPLSNHSDTLQLSFVIRLSRWSEIEQDSLYRNIFSIFTVVLNRALVNSFQYFFLNYIHNLLSINISFT